MPFLKHALLIGSCALAYVGLFLLNLQLFTALAHDPHVHWVFMPSGLRLLLVLLFVESGALAVALASVGIALSFQHQGDWVKTLGAGMISGIAPLMARHLCIQHFKLSASLTNLSGTGLLKIAAIFSILSATLHQLLFAWRDGTEGFLQSTAIMAVGDFLGTLIVLYSAKALLALVPSPRRH